MEVLIKLINICRKRDQGDLWGGYDEKGRLHAVAFIVWQEVPPGIWLVEEIRLFGSPERTV